MIGEDAGEEMRNPLFSFKLVYFFKNGAEKRMFPLAQKMLVSSHFQFQLFFILFPLDQLRDVF